MQWSIRGSATDGRLLMAGEAFTPELGFWKLSLRRFLHHRAATISLCILGIIILAAIILPILQGTAYEDLNYTHPYAPPFQNLNHLFGTDDLGRDELARLVRGARVL